VASQVVVALVFVAAMVMERAAVALVPVTARTLVS
jgi:hypothetical protein